jgi:PmbA protein
MRVNFDSLKDKWQEIADAALARASELGIELELKFGASDALSVKVRKGELDELRQSAPFGVSLRVFKGQRAVSASSSHVDKRSVLELLARAADNVTLVDEDMANGLPDKDLLYAGDAQLEVFDAGIAKLTVDRTFEMAKTAEDAAFAVDKRVTNSSGASVGVNTGVTAIYNSFGLATFQPRSSVSLSVSPVAEDEEGEKYSDGWWHAARFAADLAAPKDVGQQAGERCVALIGAEKVATGKFPVVFAPETAKDLVSLLFNSVAGTAVYKKSTFLTDAEGKPVASELVTIIDDPHRQRGLGSAPFDGEGVATSKQTLVDKGTLKFYPCNSFAARRLGRKSTGHSGGGNSVSSHNLYLENGETPAAEILAGVKEGLFVTAFIGFSFNQATGDFSRGVRGFWVKDGKLGKPVQETTVSGNLGQMLKDVVAVGDDLTFRFGTDSPTVKIREMMVSGA